MKLDSLRDLKASLNETVIAPMAASIAARKGMEVAAQPAEELGTAPPTIALGAMPAGEGDYVLAVRLQQRGLEGSDTLRKIERQAKGEVDVRYIGRVGILAGQAPRGGRTPKIGDSIGHHKITAGTLGAFVRDPKTGRALVLSNNHVLANVNRGKKGDAILSPGTLDGGRDPEDRVAGLGRFVRLHRTEPNQVDAAVAALDDGVTFDHRTLAGLGGALAGVGAPILDEQAEVGKVGRTTKTTRGRVRTIELDNLRVDFGDRTLRFDGQVEVEGQGDEPFSRGGDSGSLIVDADRLAVALLFAGSDLGGQNGRGLTYANPFAAVLSALKVELLYG